VPGKQTEGTAAAGTAHIIHKQARHHMSFNVMSAGRRLPEQMDTRLAMNVQQQTVQQTAVLLLHE
jgi:hypothetical protein